MSTGLWVVTVLCVWEGNRRSIIAPDMCRELCRISAYGLNGLIKADDYLAYAPVVSGTFYLYLYAVRSKRAVNHGR